MYGTKSRPVYVAEQIGQPAGQRARARRRRELVSSGSLSSAIQRVPGGIRPQDPSYLVRTETVALQLSLAATSSAVAIAVLTLAGTPDSGEKLMFATVFGVVLPVSWVSGTRLATPLHRRSSEHLALAAGVASAGTLAVIIAARVVYALSGLASSVILIGAGALATILIALLVRGPDRRPIRAARIPPLVQ